MAITILNRNRKGGRPALPPDELRSTQISVRFNNTEKALLEAEAKKLGVSGTEYIRNCALNKKAMIRITPPVPEVNFELYRRLVSACTNLNLLLLSSVDKNTVDSRRLEQTLVNLDLHIRETCILLRGGNA